MILILGPNGVGKTKIAYELARRQRGEIINADRTYLYKHFPICTGMQDALKESGVPRHFYGILEPEEPSISPNEFAKMVADKGDELSQAGKLAIVEGASTFYIPALLELNRVQKIFRHIIGLNFSLGFDIVEKYSKRIEQAFTEGLVDELANNLDLYLKSFLIKECHFAIPTVSYLNGELTLQEAKFDILRRCLKYKDSQMNIFSKYPEIKWIESSNFQQAHLG